MFNRKSIPCNLVIIGALICSLRDRGGQRWGHIYHHWSDKGQHMVSREMTFGKEELYSGQLMKWTGQGNHVGVVGAQPGYIMETNTWLVILWNDLVINIDWTSMRPDVLRKIRSAKYEIKNPPYQKPGLWLNLVMKLLVILHATFR